MWFTTIDAIGGLCVEKLKQVALMHNFLQHIH